MMHKRVLCLVTAAVMIGGCNPFDKGGPPKTPVVGERLPVLTGEAGVEIDAGTAALPIALPAPEANTQWAQPGGSPSKAMGHLALGSNLGLAWNTMIGQGSSKDARLAAGPVVADGRVYTIDTTSTVRAFDVRTGAPVWTASFGFEKDNRNALFGGGVAYDNGRIYATNGLGFAAALNSANGSVVWQVRPGGPLRGAPTVAGDAVYMVSQDNQIYSLKTQNGATNWSVPASLEIAGVFGSASPSYAQGTVVAGFSSGELNAYRYENGRMVWQDTLARTSVSTSVSRLSDIDANPVIDQGRVYAVGQGGRMVALDLISGQRVWELNISGRSTPWVAGEWLFVVTDDAKLIAIAKSTGKIRWINELPRWQNPKARRGPIYYQGPVLAGGRLIVGGSNGVLVNVDPDNGSFQSQTNVGSGVSLQPVVANGTLFILSDHGRLIAYR